MGAGKESEAVEEVWEGGKEDRKDGVGRSAGVKAVEDGVEEKGRESRERKGKDRS